MYNNLIYLLVVILLLATGPSPEQAQLPWAMALLLFFGKGVLFNQLARYFFRRKPPATAARYFAVEQRLSILAILLPWLIISALFDLLLLAPFPRLQEFLASPWGEPILVLLSLLGLIFFLPLAIIRLWG